MLAFYFSLDLVMRNEVDLSQTDDTAFLSNGVDQLINHLQSTVNDSLEG